MFSIEAKASFSLCNLGYVLFLIESTSLWITLRETLLEYLRMISTMAMMLL